MRTPAERHVLGEARAIKRREARALKASRPASAATGAFGQRAPRRKERDYLAWLHEDIPCVACLIDGGRPIGPIEAAHQKLAIAGFWKEGGGGMRTHDERCVPLCRWHHRIDVNACDNGQRKFWDRLGVRDEVVTLCRELHDAFKWNQSGEAVVRRFSTRIRGK